MPFSQSPQPIKRQSIANSSIQIIFRLAVIMPIGGKSYVNHRSIHVDNPVTNRGTRPLLGPTEVSQRRTHQTIHLQWDATPAPIPANPLPLGQSSVNPMSILYQSEDICVSNQGTSALCGQTTCFNRGQFHKQTRNTMPIQCQSSVNHTPIGAPLPTVT